MIAGISGSGKSTLLHLLGGLDRPDQGEVLFAGTDLAARTESERTELRRRQIGFVFQAFNLVPVLSAYENVEYGLWLSGAPKGRAAPARRGRARGGRPGGADDPPPRSPLGGERQRVALARALVQEPRVILADEPTASLDSRTAGEMLQLLLELNATRSATFVFADSALVAHAPRVLHLVDGRIVDDLARR